MPLSLIVVVRLDYTQDTTRTNKANQNNKAKRKTGHGKHIDIFNYEKMTCDMSNYHVFYNSIKPAGGLLIFMCMQSLQSQLAVDCIAAFLQEALNARKNKKNSEKLQKSKRHHTPEI